MKVELLFTRNTQWSLGELAPVCSGWCCRIALWTATCMQLSSSTWKPLSRTVVQALQRWLHYLQNPWGPGLVFLSVFAKFSFGNARTLHPFNCRLFKFLKHEVLTTKLPWGLLVWATLMSVFFQKMQLLQYIAYTTVTAFLNFECLSLRTFFFLRCGEVVNTYKNFPLSLQYIISSTFSERSSKPICWHVLPHTIERSHGIDFKCWQGRPVNLSSPQPVKFSPSRTEHTLPDIQIHGLLTIDIPRKKAFFPPRDYHFYFLLSHGLNGWLWQSLINRHRYRWSTSLQAEIRTTKPNTI